MRDLAIIRATLRELAPLLFGALAIGLVIALTSLKDVRPEAIDRWNTWPLCVMPVAALWGGLALTGSRSTLVHLLARPVARERLLAWRLAVLLVGLAVVALPLWWIGSHQFANAPSVATIAVATVLAALFGAQGATFTEREPTALACALVLAAPLVLPVQLALESERMTWSRVHGSLGWWLIVPLAAAATLHAVPLVRSWRLGLPVRSVAVATKTVFASLVATLVIVFAIVRPILTWLGAPERGELITVVAATSDGVIVATGTRGGDDGDRDVVDGLVVIRDDGTRRVLWNRREEAPDETVWKIAVPELSFRGWLDDTIQLDMIGGLEPDSRTATNATEVPADIIAQGWDQALVEVTRHEHGEHCCDIVFGDDNGHRVAIRGNVVTTLAPGQRSFHHLQTVRSSEVTFQRWNGVAVARGRMWGVAHDGTLWTTRMPWGGEP